MTEEPTEEPFVGQENYISALNNELMRSYRLVMKAGVDVDTNDSATSITNMSARQVCPLQQWCRRAILRSLTLHRVDKINELPLPNALNACISTFSVPEDFDTDGFHMTYNFHFPNHPHHKTHRVHPARYLIDKTRVLIKAQNNNCHGCSVCSMLGEELRVHQESDRWALANHPHIQRCFMKMINDKTAITCYVLEFPLINLKDVAIKLSISSIHIPEFLLWDTMYKMASALNHLHELNLSTGLCEPQNFVLMSDGQVKVENLLLYLPTMFGVHTYRTCVPRQKVAIYTAPETWLGWQWNNFANMATTIWGLGCVFYELAALCPAFLLETYTMKISLVPGTWFGPNDGVHLRPQTPPPLPPAYSHQLGNVIGSCLREMAEDRPSLCQIMDVAAFNATQLKPHYSGPKTLLDLLPDFPMED